MSALFLLLVVAAGSFGGVSADGGNGTTSPFDDFQRYPGFNIAFTAFMIVLGLVELAFGYKLFRFTLFALGFISAGLLVFVPMVENLQSSAALWISLGAGGAAGLMAGIIGARWTKIGVFFAGAALGAILGMVLTTLVLYKLFTDNPTVVMGVSSSLLGVAFGVGAIFLMRIIVIISTVVVGAFLLIAGIGWNVPAPNSFPNVLNLAAELEDGGIPRHVYGYVAGIGVAATLGLVLQFRLTARRPKTGVKDKWEQEVEDSDLSLSGKKKKRRTSRAKSGKKKRRNHEKVRPEALLDDYETGVDGAYYADASGYDDAGGEHGEYYKTEDCDDSFEGGYADQSFDCDYDAYPRVFDVDSQGYEMSATQARAPRVNVLAGRSLNW